jgi:hypothetical protein
MEHCPSYLKWPGLKIWVREWSDEILFDDLSNISIVMSDGCSMTFESVQFGDKYECRHKLLSAQCGKVI